jgi:siroheme synthase
LSAVPASAGIPVTHRGLSSQVTIASGHDVGALDFDALGRVDGTVVLFMALGNLNAIAAGLIACGRDPQTPAAVVSAGSTPAQQVATAPLAELAEAAGELESPALVVIGDVVKLRQFLQNETRQERMVA